VAFPPAKIIPFINLPASINLSALRQADLSADTP